MIFYAPLLPVANFGGREEHAEGEKKLMLVFVCSFKSCGAPLSGAGTFHRLKNEVSHTVNESCKEEKSSLRDTGDLAELC